MAGVLNETIRTPVNSCKILVVGAGGIGCELLKNLVLTGFGDIKVIDLDTIDVSNLNRQFLFRKQHVGKSKCQVAKETAEKYNPDAKITAYHDNIMSSDYGSEFFSQFSIVMNALDNRAARNHVNRMCLASDVPLIESGTAGYLGQVTVIKKGLTECYECQPKPAQKSYPGCTIRNTPSEPVHCVVWAKHLFNQLFGEHDPDQDVSPDTADPELAAAAGKTALENEAKSDIIGGIERKSTRSWAEECGYDPVKLFNKLFHDDIQYLLSMETLWKKRRSPLPVQWEHLPADQASNDVSAGIQDQKVWSLRECAAIFEKCLSRLKAELAKQGHEGILVWDKDDDVAMDFVTCAANIRAHIFSIGVKSRFDVKSIAGNIIPAIATTNAIIAALIVMEALKILAADWDKCKTVYLNRQANPRKKLLVPCVLDKPNPKCYVCSSKPEVMIMLNTEKVTIKALTDNILKDHLGMVAPDVEIDDGKGTILISSEEGETEENEDKFLSYFSVQSGSRLKCDDFLQNYTLIMIISHVEKLEDDAEFQFIGDLAELQPQFESEAAPGTSNEASVATNGAIVEDIDDLMVIEEDEFEMDLDKRKRKAGDDINTPQAKKVKVGTDDTHDIITV